MNWKSSFGKFEMSGTGSSAVRLKPARKVASMLGSSAVGQFLAGHRLHWIAPDLLNCSDEHGVNLRLRVLIKFSIDDHSSPRRGEMFIAYVYASSTAP